MSFNFIPQKNSRKNCEFTVKHNSMDFQAECQGMEISVDDIHAFEEAKGSRSTQFSKNVT